MHKALLLYEKEIIADDKLKEQQKSFTPPVYKQISSYKPVKLMNLFTIIKAENFIIKNTNKGLYPLISSSGENNGVVKYID